MKKLILGVILSITVLSCSKNKYDGTETKTIVEIEKGNIDDFYSVSSEYDKEEKPTDIVYIYKGNLKNTSTQLFEYTTIKLEINLILENGNILTEREYGSGFLGEGIMAINNIKDWRPNEVREVKGFLSVDIPVKYIDYPIKSVVGKYSFESIDQINNKNENFVIEKDLTEKWKSLIIRIRDGKADYNKKSEIRKLFQY